MTGVKLFEWDHHHGWVHTEQHNEDDAGHHDEIEIK
jgi:hypothetical protein